MLHQCGLILPPHPFLHLSRRRATILFFICRAAGRPSFSSFVAPPGDHSFLHFLSCQAPIHIFIHRAAGRQSVSSFIPPPGANPFLHWSRRRAPIYNIFILRAAGRQSILSSFFAPPGANPFYLHSSRCGAPIHILIPSRRRALSQIEFVSVRRRAIIKNHRANGQSSRIIPPTGDYQQSSRRRAIINNHCADM